MASLSNIYLKKETLETLLKGVESKGVGGIGITISIDDEPKNYGQNVSAFVSQSKEERDEKKNRYYVGNGKVFWTDGVIKVAPRDDQQTSNNQQASNDQGTTDDLPF